MSNITNATELQNMSLSGSHVLMNDIDLTGISWTPIGTLASPFTGSLDGNGYSIIGLDTMSFPTGSDYVGLFGNCVGATITNLSMTGLSIVKASLTEHSEYWGGLAGRFAGGTITNVNVSGAITVSDGTGFNWNYIGGMIGNLNGTITITNCWTNVAISITNGNPDNLGGFFGYGGTPINAGGINGTITACYALGNITGSGVDADEVGGFAGEFENDNGNLTFTNCYASGNISFPDSGGFGHFSVGGFVGGAYHDNLYTYTFSGCYATGTISCLGAGDHFEIGGFVGSGYGGFYNNCYCTGSVTVTSSDDEVVEVGGFAGILYLYAPSGVGYGLSGCYCTGAINVTAAAGFWIYYIGGFAGEYYGNSVTGGGSTLIYDCYSTSVMTITGDAGGYIGGFIGESPWVSEDGIQKCYHDGDMTLNFTGANFTSDFIGGFYGYLFMENDAIIQDCYCKGTLTIDHSGGANEIEYIGGFLGYGDFLADTCQIRNSYSAVDLVLTHATSTLIIYIGGFVGQMNTPAAGTSFSNLYSAGSINVSDSNSNVGGFAGDAGAGTYNNCWWWTGAGPSNADDGASPVSISGEPDNEQFFEETHDVYTAGSPVWDFSTPIWLTVCEDYPDFVGLVCATCENNANPIACMMDLLTNKRYGLGNYMDVTDLDLDQLALDAAYCDELIDDGNGGTEPRHRLDVVIDSRVRAMDLISQLSASFRGLPFYSAGKVQMKIDRPQAVSSQVFGMGNILKDSFTQKWKSDKERFNMIEVQFLDKNKDYQQETIVVVDEEAFETNNEDQKPHQLRLFVTRISEAIREGRYAMKVSKYIDKTISFKTQLNAIVAQPGDRIDISHDVPGIGSSGTIQGGSTTSSIELDREVTVQPSTTYKLKVVFADDTIEETTVTNSPGTYSTITVSPALSQAPVAFDKYVFGIENILVEPARIVSIERDNSDDVTIACVPYKEDVYTDDVLVLPETKFSQLNTDFPQVTGLTVTEAILRGEDGVISNLIDVAWIPPDLSNSPLNSYSGVRIYISDNGGTTYTLAGETTGNSFQIDEGLVANVEYTVKVVVVNGKGVEGSLDNAPSGTVTTHTSIINAIDLWSKNRQYLLTGVSVTRANMYNSGYVRDVFVLETANSWKDVEGQDWDGFDLHGQTVGSSGSIEQTKSIDLGLYSKYTFSPTQLFQNIAGGSAKVQIATSDDNVTFSSYADINPSTEYQTRYVKFKHVIETSDTDEQVYLYSDIVDVDSPRVLT